MAVTPPAMPEDGIITAQYMEEVRQFIQQFHGIVNVSSGAVVVGTGEAYAGYFLPTPPDTVLKYTDELGWRPVEIADENSENYYQVNDEGELIAAPERLSERTIEVLTDIYGRKNRRG